MVTVDNPYSLWCSKPKSLININCVSLICLKAIIQSLRENGVLSSAIVSAHASSKLKHNSTTKIPQRKSDAPPKSQATGRKIMEISGATTDSAVPPLSPPCSDDLITEK